MTWRSSVDSISPLSRRQMLRAPVGAAIALAVSGCAHTPAAHPVVPTRQGQVRGVMENGVAVFRGIPYAEAPIGRLRFKPPAPKARWDGARDASRFGLCHPQVIGPVNLHVGPQGDDCLNLNVWTPSLGAARLPVLFWIHGGALTMGAGSERGYDGATFARDGIVTVTINYRLAGAGFMHVGDREGTGAFGLLDQIAALRWVQDNIAAFGGDPDNVTIAGQSAGSNCAGALLVAPAARGLFRRAILQSGIVPCQVRAEAAAVTGSEILRRLGVKDEEDIARLSTADLLAAQAAVDAETLPLLAARGVAPDFVTTVFAHTLHLVHGTDTLPTPTLPAIAGGAARDFDLLLGTNVDEFGYLADLVPVLGEQATNARLGLAAMTVAGDPQAALQLYRRNRPDASELHLTYAFMTDLVFRVPMISVADAALRHNPRIHMYSFACGTTAARATHVSELPFTWDTIGPGWDGIVRLPDNPPLSLAVAMHGAWAEFIKGHVPSHALLPQWPRYNTQRRPTMVFDAAPRVENDPAGDERRLWPNADYMS